MKRRHSSASYYVFAGLMISFICLGTSPETNAQDEASIAEKINWQQGPSLASLSKWAEIRLPAGDVFAQGDDTRELMEAMGNVTSGDEVGFYAPDGGGWFAVFEFNDVGYIRDDEKSELDADAMLKSIRQGTEQSNKIRRERGFPGLHIIGWETKPHYSEKTHNLEWATRAKDDNEELIINHNIRLLSRRGVMKVTLVVVPEQLASTLPVFQDRLQDLTFKSGQKYEEFIQGDKVAKYGLTALVVGGATAVAVKTGLLKYIWKFLVLIAIAVSAFSKRIFGKRKVDQTN